MIDERPAAPTPAVRATIPCAWCGRHIQWDRIGRVEYDDGLNEDVCASCLHRGDTG